MDAVEISAESGWLRFNWNKKLKRSSDATSNRAHAVWAVSIHQRRMTLLDDTPTWLSSFLHITVKDFNTLRTGLLNCVNARSWGLTFRHRASCI